MLPKSSRIPRKDFSLLFKNSQFFHSPHFSLRVAHSTKPQIAVTVSKKISKKAVTRNKIRRRAYSALREIISSLKPGLYLFVAKNGSETVQGEKLQKELESLVVSCRL